NFKMKKHHAKIVAKPPSFIMFSLSPYRCKAGAKITHTFSTFQIKTLSFFTKRNSCLKISSYFLCGKGKTNYKN
ncbi:hypothetical protein, partial [Marinifilum breve]|uniref:hypothetical protein n=1 Tax=Marinifilum breve TaxID=2184082 RepID=UPI001A9C7F95